MKTFLMLTLTIVPGLVFAQKDSMRADTREMLKEHAQKDHIILNWSWDAGKSSQITVEASIMNPYKKDIRAMWLTFSVFDAKGNPVKDVKTGKTTAVIESKRLHTANGGYIDYKFEKVFTARSVDEMRVEEVKLEFADNTVKTINGSRAVGEP